MTAAGHDNRHVRRAWLVLLAVFLVNVGGNGVPLAGPIHRRQRHPDPAFFLLADIERTQLLSGNVEDRAPHGVARLGLTDGSPPFHVPFL